MSSDFIFSLQQFERSFELNTSKAFKLQISANILEMKVDSLTRVIVKSIIRYPRDISLQFMHLLQLQLVREIFNAFQFYFVQNCKKNHSANPNPSLKELSNTFIRFTSDKKYPILKTSLRNSEGVDGYGNEPKGIINHTITITITKE